MFPTQATRMELHRLIPTPFLRICNTHSPYVGLLSLLPLYTYLPLAQPSQHSYFVTYNPNSDDCACPAAHIPRLRGVESSNVLMRQGVVEERACLLNSLSRLP